MIYVHLIKLKFLELYGRLLARDILIAIRDPRWVEGSNPFLCCVLRDSWKTPLGLLACWHINRLFQRAEALGFGKTGVMWGHISGQCDYLIPPTWLKRREINERFYLLLADNLRNGNFDWGVVIDIKEMGLEEYMFPDDYVLGDYTYDHGKNTINYVRLRDELAKQKAESATS